MRCVRQCVKQDVRDEGGALVGVVHQRAEALFAHPSRGESCLSICRGVFASSQISSLFDSLTTLFVEAIETSFALATSVSIGNHCLNDILASTYDVVERIIGR